MNQATWRDSDFSPKRLVLAERLPAHYAAELRGLARDIGVPVSADGTRPASGDLWVASHPGGNGDFRWVGAIEVPDAIRWLRERASTAVATRRSAV